TDYCLAEDTWKEVQDVTFKGEIIFSKPLTGIYNHGKFNYDDAQDVKITATGSLINANGTAIKSFTNVPAVLVHGEEYDYFQFDIDQWRVQTYSELENFREKTIKKVLMRSNMSTQDQPTIESSFRGTIKSGVYDIINDKFGIRIELDEHPGKVFLLITGSDASKSMGTFETNKHAILKCRKGVPSDSSIPSTAETGIFHVIDFQYVK
ncbi:MAG: hypothetical protein MIO92_11315, partial [Methanosarcinaceae archaeon]|nr:hypothetical protein [Methanosarcinaceae archaeon]